MPIRRQTNAGRRWFKSPLVVFVSAIAILLSVVPAYASHPEASLAGSNFEIDDNANLKLDDPAPSLDWGSLAHPSGPELRETDAPTGQNDDSYKGGVKEDTECPGEVTGSIPNNKSDLLTFHVYEEPGVGTHPGFLNLAWSRVSDPSGTTLMDFEFNQSTTPCSVGPNVVRTEGDLLIEYAIDQGGARADISGRFWTGTEWGDPIDLDDGEDCGGGPCAVGTINQSVISASDSDGLGEKQARTFGEAQIDLRLIFDADSCTSFGSAMLKSRSSDAFTSQLKDFIEPVPIDLQNCGRVIIRKQTLPDEDPNTTTFGYTKSFSTDPTTANTFTLTDDGVKDYGATVLFGSGYTVTEDVIPAGWEFVSLDCSASSASTSYLVSNATVTFTIDGDSDRLDCTYTNREQVGAIEITKTRKHAAGGSGDQPHAGVGFTITGGDLPEGGVVRTTGNDGTACLDGLALASYTVTETVPAGYVSDDDTKSVSVTAVSACGDGNEAEVSFDNTPLTDVSVTVDSQVDGGTASTIECWDGAISGDADYSANTGTTIGSNGDGTLEIEDLLPTDPAATITCVITVDP
jgi:hypothetical protein